MALIVFYNNVFHLRAIKTWLKERKEPKNKKLPQFEQDFNLSPLQEHFMFWEYLEIGNYTTVTYLDVGLCNAQNGMTAS